MGLIQISLHFWNFCGLAIKKKIKVFLWHWDDVHFVETWSVSWVDTSFTYSKINLGLLGPEVEKATWPQNPHGLAAFSVIGLVSTEKSNKSFSMIQPSARWKLSSCKAICIIIFNTQFFLWFGHTVWIVFFHFCLRLRH